MNVCKTLILSGFFLGFDVKNMLRARIEPLNLVTRQDQFPDSIFACAVLSIMSLILAAVNGRTVESMDKHRNN